MNDRRRAASPPSFAPEQPPDPDPWAQDDELAYGGSSANPALDDYDAQVRAAWGPGYSGEGSYSSADFDPDVQHDYDYDYAGFKGDAGFDEIGDQQYGGGRYAAGGPFEGSDEFGSGDFRRERGSFGELQREFELRTARSWARPQDSGVAPPRTRGEHGAPFAPGWNDARDWADPAGFRTFRPRPTLAARGPKNYRRSDERLLEDIYLHLLNNPALDSSDVSIEVHRGVATLSGTVPTRHMKHEMEDLILAIPGIEEVHNRVKVNSGPLDPG
ncbi:MAG TPA: BON domain-containing protein [Steroidobacteraceae bacterium]|nr:BON domain-containing protein [Steroidobacteraceae bacterium]